jgi:acetyltransferase-like isoleucine patch superfamily enzyme
LIKRLLRRALVRLLDVEEQQPAAAATAQEAPAQKGPVISHPDRVFGMETAQSVHPTAAFYIHENMPPGNPLGKIVLGRGAYIGKDVELATTNFIIIGEDTSLQDYCRISGDVEIGANCIFANYIFLGSGLHRFRDRPEWLIRDQDRAVFEDPTIAKGPISRPIVVEEDCWLGWGVVLTPGVHIGRGAVIGANCVVTDDVAPYEIHGGIPNVQIGTRLRFDPPAALSALEDACLPYFYRGFLCRQMDLARSRVAGIIEAGPKALVVIRAEAGRQLVVRGKRLDFDGPLVLSIRVDGVEFGAFSVNEHSDEELFTIQLQMPDRKVTANMPRALMDWTCIELHHPAPEGSNIVRYGLSSVRSED